MRVCFAILIPVMDEPRAWVRAADAGESVKCRSWEGWGMMWVGQILGRASTVPKKE